MTASKPLTAARIHAILRKAGFERSKKETTRVRGWYHYTQGYTLEPSYQTLGVPDGCFRVRHRNDSQGYGRPDDPAERIAAYAKALDDAGLSVENDGNFGIIVR
jgi:hypothetical protein